MVGIYIYMLLCRYDMQSLRANRMVIASNFSEYQATTLFAN